ncbi:DoxX family protein [Aliiroseovarius sp. 2305UL8-7]|uniref:DoxX family protein n=1 Tax=Aliiroseovarius conchicola TaxID=3121637 RepID=UPI003528447B
MHALANMYNSLVNLAERMAPATITTLARFTFAATLVGYFWASALTKTGPGLLGVFQPTLGAYAQMFPKMMEAVSYDASKLGSIYYLIAVAGTLAEYILPFLIVVGLLTRLSSIGMIGFIIVQTLTDLYGHGAIDHPETVGAWFDRIPDSLIMDQRLFWMAVLITLVLKGGGPLSLDRLLKIR